jgi:transcriptional regulator with XRE-family HTH domain
VTGFYRARQQFGARLRRLREEAGLSGKQLAERLDWAPSKVSRLEHGKQTASSEDVTDWASAVSADHLTDDLLADLRTVRFEYATWNRKLRRGTAPRQHASVTMEAAASTIHAFETALIPGLLQTADYARHILSNVVALRRIPNDIERGVRLRLRRQEALYDPTKHFRFLLTEAALRYQPCPASTLCGQLDRLHGLFGLDTVEIAILPFDTRLPIAPVNGFWIFDDAVVLVETLSAELTLRDPDDVLV